MRMSVSHLGLAPTEPATIPLVKNNSHHHGHDEPKQSEISLQELSAFSVYHLRLAGSLFYLCSLCHEYLSKV